MRLLRLSSACVAAALCLSGCGYRLGPTNSVVAGEKSVQITPFSNQTFEPRPGDAVTTALRRELQRDGTSHLATHGTADIVVTGVVTRYRRHELSFEPKDVLTVRDYRINVTAKVTARETSSGKILFEKEIMGYTLIRVGNDLTSAERQALPLLAADLAKNVASQLVDGTW